MPGNASGRAATPDGQSPALRPWLAGAVLLGLTAMVYRPVLRPWLQELWDDPNYSHGLVIPLVSIWFAWEQRLRLAALTPRPALSAILLVAGGIALLAAGLVAAELFLARISLLVVLVGLLASLLGYGYVRALALPLAFLLFAIPLPTLVLNNISFPLQILASEIAIAILQAANIPSLREGNVILLPNVSLEVVEACSGLRSLMTLAALSVAIAALTLRSGSTRGALVAMSVPVAVITNGARIAGTGVLAYHFGRKVADGFFHGFSGWAVFMTALGLLLSIAALLRRVAEP